MCSFSTQGVENPDLLTSSLHAPKQHHHTKIQVGGNGVAMEVCLGSTKGVHRNFFNEKRLMISVKNSKVKI